MQPGVFLSRLSTKLAEDDLQRVTDAVEFSVLAHAGQKRLSGEPYIAHVIATAQNLVNWDMDVDTIIAGLLHDVPEDTTYTLNDIEQLFGPRVSFLVGGVTKVSQLKYRGLERYVENLRKMFVAMAEDVRVMIIKFADRLHNLSTLEFLPPDKQLRIARESLEIFAPLAHRLGMGGVKGALEDLSFPYVLPEEYRWLKSIVGPRYELLTKEAAKMETIIRGQLSAANVAFVDIHGRRKHLYSLYEKIIRPEYHRDITLVSDLMALRIIVPTLADCYSALGIIHQLWPPVPGRFKDYVAQPKPNGYQSLHTTVFGLHGQAVEIQIRDRAMHQLAEHGVAAHWHYSESGKPLQGLAVSSKLAWIQQLAEWKQGDATHEQFLQRLKIDALQKRIFCFTPGGDVIDLPLAATPIDFAYHVHSDLGDHCTGAKVNDMMAALDTPLQSGDVVEIIMDKHRKRPNRDWLAFVRTETARDHIRRAWRDGEEFPSAT